MQTTYLFVCYHTAWTEKGCKNPSNDLHSDLGDSYKSGLQNWCKTKKASAIFDWFASSAWHLSAHYHVRSLPTFGLVAWSILLVFTVLAFRREQKANRRELMVLPPVSDGISYSNIQPADEEQLDDKSESARGYTLDVYRKTDTTYHHPASARTVYPLPSVDHHPMLSRTSIDVYGAFDGDGMPRVDEPSRTMQLAYTDPCKIFDGMTDSEAHSVTSIFLQMLKSVIPLWMRRTSRNRPTSQAFSPVPQLTPVTDNTNGTALSNERDKETDGQRESFDVLKEALYVSGWNCDRVPHTNCHSSPGIEVT